MVRDLSKSVSLKYAYVKEKVIFDIKTYDNGDSCAYPISGDTVDDSGEIVSNATCPFITLTIQDTNGDTKTEKRYFANYITDGDTFDGSHFKKTIHSNNKEGDIEKKFGEYYVMLCKDEIAKAVLKYDFDTLNGNPGYLGIPNWILESSAYTVEGEGIEKIKFDEGEYKRYREEGVQKLIYNSALKTANDYNFMLNTPSKPEDIKITPKS